MKKLMLPLILLLLGTGSGVGAAFFLKSDEPEHTADAVCTCEEADLLAITPEDVASEALETPETTEFAKLNNQFVIPVVAAERITAMVVLSLSIEVQPGNKEVIFSAEPKLRDAFLQVMFDHANIGGFSGNFTVSTNMRILRQELLRAAKAVVGDNALDVLILDIVRQDI